MISARHPTRRRLTAVGSVLALASMLGACAPAATASGTPTADEQPAGDAASDATPLPPGKHYKGTNGRATDTCSDPMPGSYC